MPFDDSMLFVGLDIGGTNVKAGLLDGETGELVVGVKEELLPRDGDDRSPEAVVDMLIALAQSLLDEVDISWDDTLYVGVGCPGQIERETGTVVGASSFPSWHNVPLASLVEERTGRPVTVLNDASAAASAEFAGRGSQETIAVLTLGTGIGLGVVCGGRVVTGSRGLLEGGHMIVEPGAKGRLCACGQRGCLEAYASAAAVATIASERLSGLAASRSLPAAVPPPSSGAEAPPASGNGTGGKAEVAAPESSRGLPTAPTTPTTSPSPSPRIPKRKSMNRSDSAVSLRIREFERRTSASAPGSPSTPSGLQGSGSRRGMEGGGGVAGVRVDITAADVFAMARQGDEVAIQVVEETCDYLGLACVNICRVLDPDAILLAGGLSKAEGLVDKVKGSFSSRGWKVLPHECEISLASSCVAAGVIGAAGAAACEYSLAKRRNRKRSSEGGSGSHARSAPPTAAAAASSSRSRGSTDGKREAGGWKSFFFGVGLGMVVAGAVAASFIAVAPSRGMRMGSR